ncbi:MAG TPA: histidine phosphatase family protein [Candidatus Dormibacteraeota bacterium]|nr:histidine phosphatase family protein [Candidatus Dormibacteraeota bacterium]
MTRVFLIRHADVENPHKVLYGHLPNFPLSALGRAQAGAVGESLQGAGLTLIVHSPLDRAVETARIIASHLDPAPGLETDETLREAEFSRYLQGLPYWQIPLRRPKWWIHQWRPGVVAQSESVADMGGRVLKVAERLAKQHPGGVVAIVSHADPLQAAWVLLDGRPQTQREIYRKQVLKSGMLDLEMDGEQVESVRYVPPPQVG